MNKKDSDRPVHADWYANLMSGRSGSYPPCLCTSVPRSASYFPFSAISAYNSPVLQSVALPHSIAARDND